MKKKTLFSLVITFALSAAMFIACGLIGLKGNDKAYAETSKPEPVNFAMRSGASIKYSDPTGIRFTTYVNPDYYDDLVASGKAFHFGTIYAPATAYSGTIEDFTHASAVVDGVNDIVVEDEDVWGIDTVNDVDYMIYNTVQLYNVNARNNGYYGVKILAKSYVWIDDNGNGEEDAGEYTYVDSGVVRSIAQVAASALADGNDSEYIDIIPGYALNAKNLVGSNDTAVTVNGFTYHKDGANSYDKGRDNRDYIYLPSGGTCDVKYTPALKHSGAYMTGIDDYTITYKSADESVFTVNGNGKVSAVGVGSAALTECVGSNVAAPNCTVKVLDASTEYNAQGVAVSYLLDDVTYYADSHILVLDADYIAAKMAEGYTQVQFTIDCPGTGGSGKSVRLFVNAAETTIASGSQGESFSSDVLDLASNTAYSILCRQSTAETLDMTVVAQFIKPINAFVENNHAVIAYSATASTDKIKDDTITYTFESVSNGTFARFYFNESYIAEKIAAGYTDVSFVVGTWGNKEAFLLENETEIGHVLTNGNDGFDCGVIPLNEDAYYCVRLYHNLPTGNAAPSDINIVVKFFKQVYGCEAADKSDIAFASATSTTITANDTITYTFESVKNAIFNNFYFTESFIAEKMAEGYTRASFVVGTWGNKAATLYENDTEKGSVLTNGNDGFDCGVIELAENAYYYISLYHNLPTGNAAPSDIDVVVQFYKPEALILSDIDSWGYHYHGKASSVTAGDGAISVSSVQYSSTFRGFTLLPAAIQALYDAGISTLSFKITVPEGCYIDLYNMADPASCIVETPVFIDGTEYYYASGSTVTLNIENLVGGLNNAEGLKFVVTYGASWTAYNADCVVTFSDITVTKQS